MENERSPRFYDKIQQKKTYHDIFSRDTKIRAFDSIFDLSQHNFNWKTAENKEKVGVIIGRRSALYRIFWWFFLFSQNGLARNCSYSLHI